MIIAEIETHSVNISAGVLSAVVPVKTDRGIVAMNISFRLKEHPELDAVVPMIDEAVRKALARSVGMAAQPAPEAKS
jgi:hypothetical protein